MSTNDLIILDKIMEDVQKTSFKTYSTGKFFEIFCAEQILKNYDLSLEEIESGITDGCNDGCKDGARATDYANLTFEDLMSFVDIERLFIGKMFSRC